MDTTLEEALLFPVLCLFHKYIKYAFYVFLKL